MHHSDLGSQHVSIVYNDTLTGLGIKASTGTVGDPYDNALAETVNALYKTELIYTGQWESLAEVEFATLVVDALVQHRSPPSGTGLPNARRGHPHLQSTPDTNTGDHPLKETEQNPGRFTPNPRWSIKTENPRRFTPPPSKPSTLQQRAS